LTGTSAGEAIFGGLIVPDVDDDDSKGCNQWAGELPSERLGRAYVFLNKSHKAIPYINKPFKPRRRLMSLFASYIDPPEDAQSSATIDLAPWPAWFDPDGSVVFGSSRDGYKEAKRMKVKKVKPDVVVYATGYRQIWDWLGSHYPKGPEDERVDVLEICSSEDPSIGFIGFLRPGVGKRATSGGSRGDALTFDHAFLSRTSGAIPPMAEIQAMLWTLLLQKRIPIPKVEPVYRLLASKQARIQYGVCYCF
jgi:dimethylaniline monooxygenase (N-oxide forming)